MKNAFLSYGWCDASLVAQFGEELEKSGISVFLDQWDIPSGGMVWATIDRAIDQASKLVLFLSRDSLEGKGVKEELSRGLQKAYEKHGEVFIVPVALDPYDDISPLLSVRVRGANTIRASELGFSGTLEALKSGILDKPHPRKATTAPTDFYYRLYALEDSMVIELGTGLPIQDGFGFETVWPNQVKWESAGMGPPGNPSLVAWEQGMWVTGQGCYIPEHPDTRICPAYANRSIRRNESFYIRVSTPDGGCPESPQRVRLYDHFSQLVRDAVPRHPESS